MNDTNRAVNRTVLFIVGIVLLASGAAALSAVLWPSVGTMWRNGLSNAVDWMVNANQVSRVGETATLSGFVIAVLVLLVLIVILAVFVISRFGGGRSNTVFRDEAGDGAQGAVTIRHGFASDAITHALHGREDLLASRVTARHLRNTDVLHVTVTPRQNTSPADVAMTVTMLVDNLATLTGRDTPALVSIHSGIRSRLAADQSRVD